MKKAAILIAGVVVAGVLGAVGVYALLCLFFAVIEPGLQGRIPLGIRNASLAFACALLLWLLSRRVKTFSRPRRLGVVLLALCISALLLVGYATVYNLYTQERDWTRLREIADEIKVMSGGEGLVLSDARSLVVSQGRNESGDVYRISVNDPLVGAVFGVDLMQFDQIVVRVSPAGEVQEVHVDYF